MPGRDIEAEILDHLRHREHTHHGICTTFDMLTFWRDPKEVKSVLRSLKRRGVIEYVDPKGWRLKQPC